MYHENILYQHKTLEVGVLVWLILSLVCTSRRNFAFFSRRLGRMKVHYPQLLLWKCCECEIVPPLYSVKTNFMNAVRLMSFLLKNPFLSLFFPRMFLFQ